jgi:hypothetical protein
MIETVVTLHPAYDGTTSCCNIDDILVPGNPFPSDVI